MGVLRAMRVPIGRPENAGHALRARREALWRRPLEPVIVAWDGRPPAIRLRLPARRADRPLSCVLRFEDEGRDPLEWRSSAAERRPSKRVDVEGARYAESTLRLPVARLPLGYHRLHIEAPGISARALVISAPSTAPRPGEDGRPRRSWGVFVPLYALRSENSWGAGDFGDLERLAEWVAGLGGRSVATLPLLAALPEFDPAPSPYAPSSRLFWNELFLDVTAVPELARSEQGRSMLRSARLRRDIAALQSRDLLDYGVIGATKRRVLSALARDFFATPSKRRETFEAWLGFHPSARDYARFRAASERRGPWQGWPARERDGRLPGRAGPAEEEARRYHAYVQWLCEEQLSEVSARARESEIELYFDLPLGVHPAGYDTWRERDAFAPGASAGAPPDAFFSGGQDWGFPPLHPERIREAGYRYPIACLRHLLRHAGTLRLDHVMSLHRLFWVPNGMAPGDGVYVRHRPDEEHAVLALEASRAGAVVVGEDLGTVPARVRQSLRRHGMLRSHVMEFEIEPDARTAIRPPPADSSASIGTHDTPTFAAFWRGLDIEQRVARGWLAASDARRMRAERASLRTAIVDFVRREGRLPRSVSERPLAPQTETAVLRACLAHLAAGPAAMVMVALEDLWLETQPQNVPGTTSENPNWRRAARYPFEAFRGRPQVVGTLKEIDRLRRQERT